MNTKSILALTAASFTAGSAFADYSVPKDYPLKKCPVSDETFGRGGMKAVKVTHEGTDVWLCCKSCIKDFKRSPQNSSKW